MPGFMVAMAVVSLLATGYSMYQQYEAQMAAEEIGRRNAEIAEARTREEIKRTEENNAKQLEAARATIAASGFQLDGSLSSYLVELERIGDENVDWIGQEGRWAVEAAKAGGAYSAMQAEAGMWTSMFQGASSQASIYGNYQEVS